MNPLIVIGNLIHQAVNILAAIVVNTSEDTYPSDNTDLIDTAITESQRTTCRIKILLEKLITKQDANSIIALLKDQKVDYTLLLYLQLPESIRNTSESISYLDRTCANMKINTTSRYFYECIWKYFEEEGISPITPDKYVTATKKNLALEEYESIKKSWGNHKPLFLQTYTTREGKFVDNVYYISRTTQDGIIWFLDVLKAGTFMVKGKVYDVCGAFEHVISASTLTCQIYDCEIMSKALGDMKSVDEIKEMVLCFPQCISKIMIEKDLINIEDIVTYVVKDRTRQVGEGNFKVSNHFIGNICAPKLIHRQATDICLEKWKGKIDDVNDFVKSTGLIPESYITNGIYDSILTLDYTAMKSNGFTTAFSRKTMRDPFPRMIFADEICAGDVYVRHECFKEPQDLQNPDISDAQRRMLVYTQLYTPPKKEMICYIESTINNAISAAALKDTKEITGQCISDVRSDLPFLYKLKDTLPDAARGATLYHIPCTCCAKYMALDELHVHKSNGTIFAVGLNGEIYATCSTGSHKITDFNSQCIKVVNMYSRTGEDGRPQSVESVKGKCVHWVMIDEESMGLFVQAVKKTQEPPLKKAKI